MWRGTDVAQFPYKEKLPAFLNGDICLSWCVCEDETMSFCKMSPTSFA